MYFMVNRVTSQTENPSARYRRFGVLLLAGAAGVAMIGAVAHLADLTSDGYIELIIGFLALVSLVGMPIAALGPSLHANRPTVSRRSARVPAHAETSALALFLATASSLASEHNDRATTARLLDQFLRENHPVTYTSFDEAVDQALMAAPLVEDVEDWNALLVSALGSASDDVESAPPAAVSYVHEFSLDDITIGTPEDLSKASHFIMRAAPPDVDALWLPSFDPTPGSCGLRIITSRSLLEHFKYIRSIPISLAPRGTSVAHPISLRQLRRRGQA